MGIGRKNISNIKLKKSSSQAKAEAIQSLQPQVDGNLVSSWGRTPVNTPEESVLLEVPVEGDISTIAKNPDWNKRLIYYTDTEGNLKLGRVLNSGTFEIKEPETLLNHGEIGYLIAGNAVVSVENGVLVDYVTDDATVFTHGAKITAVDGRSYVKSESSTIDFVGGWAKMHSQNDKVNIFQGETLEAVGSEIRDIRPDFRTVEKNGAGVKLEKCNVNLCRLEKGRVDAEKSIFGEIRNPDKIFNVQYFMGGECRVNGRIDNCHVNFRGPSVITKVNDCQIDVDNSPVPQTLQIKNLSGASYLNIMGPNTTVAIDRWIFDKPATGLNTIKQSGQHVRMGNIVVPKQAVVQELIFDDILLKESKPLPIRIDGKVTRVIVEQLKHDMSIDISQDAEVGSLTSMANGRSVSQLSVWDPHKRVQKFMDNAKVIEAKSMNIAEKTKRTLRGEKI